jgi:hypothetical protein
MQPGIAAGDAPPDWVVAAAARQFKPPGTPLNLGTLIVDWLRGVGLSLELIPSVRESFSLDDVAFDLRAVAFSPPRAASKPTSRAAKMVFQEALYLPRSPGEEGELAEIPAEEPEDSVIPEDEPEPVEVTVGDLLARITVRGRARDQVKMTILITRHQDNTPVAGVHLALEANQETLAEATTNAAGVAEFPLPQGQAALVFQSPVQAELQISF